MIDRREGGATMVESAIASVVVFFLIFAVFQAAFFARTYLAASDASRAGAHAGSIAADSSSADYDILRAVAKTMSSGSLDDVVAIIVFKPQGPDFSMDPSCTNGGISGTCNRYVAADLRLSQSDFVNGANTNDDSWPAASRSTSRSVGLERIGVHVLLKAKSIGGPFPSQIAKSAIVPIEARS